MRSHEFNGHLFVVKFTLSDPLGGPSCQISYLQIFQNDIDKMFDQNWMKNVEGVVLVQADNTICLY